MIGPVISVDGKQQCVSPGTGDNTAYTNPIYWDHHYWDYTYSDTPPPRRRGLRGD